MQLYCGDPICKKTVDADPDRSPAWPVRCDGCGRGLYPQDVLEATHASELDPKPGQLMRQAGGKRVAVLSSQLSAPTAPTDADGDAAVDRLMAMVDQGDAEPNTAGKATRSGIRLAAIGAVIFALSLAWPIIGVKLGLQSFRFLFVISVIGGGSMFLGIAQIITGIEELQRFDEYGGWRKLVVCLAGVIGAVVAIVGSQAVKQYARDAGYDVIATDKNGTTQPGKTAP